MSFRTVDAVIDAARVGEHANAGNFYTVAGEIFSYSVKLAHVEDGKIVLDVPRNWKYSRTSSKHFNAVLRAID